MGGGAWPFLVGGAICLVHSDNERDSGLLNSYVGGGAWPFLQPQIRKSWDSMENANKKRK